MRYIVEYKYVENNQNSPIHKIGIDGQNYADAKNIALVKVEEKIKQLNRYGRHITDYAITNIKAVKNVMRIF